MNTPRSFLAAIGIAAAAGAALVPAFAQEPAAAAPKASAEVAPQAAATERALAVTQNDPKLQWGPCPPIFPAGCEITVLHGDPAKPHADVFFRVPGGYAIPAHWHTSPEHMVLVSGEFQVRYAGQTSATLKPGDYAFGPAKAPHEARCLSKEPCTLFIAFETAVDAHAVTEKMP